MGVRILKGGMLTTVQDLGRTGYQSQGFSVSGVMDVRSFKIANLLLDNPENEAVLEFTLMGPTLEFTSETIISITGGDFRPQINGKPAKMYTAIYMHRGDILTFGGARTGTRAPEAKAFVKSWNRVKAGQTVCILEAMKLMNEIESMTATAL